MNLRWREYAAHANTLNGCADADQCVAGIGGLDGDSRNTDSK